LSQSIPKINGLKLSKEPAPYPKNFSFASSQDFENKNLPGRATLPEQQRLAFINQFDASNAIIEETDDQNEYKINFKELVKGEPLVKEQAAFKVIESDKKMSFGSFVHQ